MSDNFPANDQRNVMPSLGYNMDILGGSLGSLTGINISFQLLSGLNSSISANRIGLKIYHYALNIRLKTNTADYGDEKQLHYTVYSWNYSSLDHALHIFINLHFEVGFCNIPFS